MWLWRSFPKSEKISPGDFLMWALGAFMLCGQNKKHKKNNPHSDWGVIMHYSKVVGSSGNLVVTPDK